MFEPPILIVGNPSESHLGSHFKVACEGLRGKCEILDVRGAYGKGIVQRIFWKLGRRPTKLKSFAKTFLGTLGREPRLVITTGIAPLEKETLLLAAKSGHTIVNYLTDDPWNLKHGSSWFFEALPHYSAVFSPRRSNLTQLKNLGLETTYLPFGYDPTTHFVDEDLPNECKTNADLVFVGGADKDRIPIIQAIDSAGVRCELFGGYWDRVALKNGHSRGIVDVAGIRNATLSAKVSLILVRRANRDEHVMRTFEAAACGGCLLVDDTVEHREIFGPDGESVCYFKTVDQACAIAKELVADSVKNRRLRENCVKLICKNGKNTYQSRMETLLDHVERIARPKAK